MRWYLDGRSGRAAYEVVHLPGARFVDLDTDLSAAVKGGPAGRHPLPEPEAFATAMGRLGIGDETTVVAYDDSGGGTAGRLVWMLRVLVRRAALLDGGLASMPDEREVGPGPAVAPASFTPGPWPAAALATADEIAAHLAVGEVALDARSADRFRGENEVVDGAPVTFPAPEPQTGADGTAGSVPRAAAIRRAGSRADARLSATAARRLGLRRRPRRRGGRSAPSPAVRRVVVGLVRRSRPLDRPRSRGTLVGDRRYGCTPCPTPKPP